MSLNVDNSGHSRLQHLGRFSPGRFSPGRFSPGRFSPGRFSPGRFSPGRFSPGRFSPRRFIPGMKRLGMKRGAAKFFYYHQNYEMMVNKYTITPLTFQSRLFQSQYVPVPDLYDGKFSNHFFSY